MFFATLWSERQGQGHTAAKGSAKKHETAGGRAHIVSAIASWRVVAGILGRAIICLRVLTCVCVCVGLVAACAVCGVCLR